MITLADFLVAPRAQIANVAPISMVYAAAGTRRQAVLAGIAPDSDDYVAWSRQQMLAACQLLFDHGVQHIFTLAAGPGQFQEVGTYRTRLLTWIAQGLTEAPTLDEFQRRGWRVRLFCGDDLPELQPAQARLRELEGEGRPTIWFQVVPDSEAPWRWLLAAVQRSHAGTRAATIRALYGEEIPPITLFLGFGKPVIAPELLPPLLAGTVQCYWTQRPGYSLTEHELRRLLYDYAYVRATWRADKEGRAAAAQAHAEAWLRGPTLGLGTRLGPFWYPLPHDSIPGATSQAPGGL